MHLCPKKFFTANFAVFLDTVHKVRRFYRMKVNTKQESEKQTCSKPGRKPGFMQVFTIEDGIWPQQLNIF